MRTSRPAPSPSFRSGRSRWPVLFLLGLWLGPLASAQPYVVVPQSSQNALDIIDTATNSLAASVALGAVPQSVVMAPNGQEAYVGVTSSSTAGSTRTVTSAVETVDLTNGTVTTETSIQSGTEAIGIGAMALAPNGSTLYLINPDTGSLLSLDLATGAVTTITQYGAASQPTALLVGSTGKHLYVALGGSSELSIVTLATGNVSTLTIPDGLDPLALALSPDGSRLYIANSGNNTIAVLDVETGSYKNSITVTGFPDSLAVSPNGQTLAAALPAAGLIDLIPLNQSGASTPVSVGRAPATLAYSADGTRLYVLDSDIPLLSVIDTANDGVLATIDLANPAVFAGTFSGAGDIVAQSASFSTSAGTTLDGSLSATDDLNRTLTYALASSPAHGQVSLDASNGTFAYTPASGFDGADHFAFTAEASSGPGAPTVPVSAPAPVRICVLPTQVSIGTIANTSVAVSTGKLVIFKPNVNCGLTYSAVSSNTALFPDSSLLLGGLGYQRTLSLTPTTGATGSADITVTAQGPGSLTASQTFSVFVGEPPVITDLPSAIDITVNTSSGPISLDLSGGTAPITLTATSSDTAVIPVSGIQFSGTGSSRTLTITPTQNQLGAAFVTITATDAHGLQSSGSTEVDVIPTSNSSAIDPTTLLVLFALLLIGVRRRHKAGIST